MPHKREIQLKAGKESEVTCKTQRLQPISFISAIHKQFNKQAMTQGLEHLLCQVRLTELGCSARRRVQGDFTAPKGSTRELERDYLQGSIYGTSQAYSHSFHLNICEKNPVFMFQLHYRIQTSFTGLLGVILSSQGHCREPTLAHGMMPPLGQSEEDEKVEGQTCSLERRSATGCSSPKRAPKVPSTCLSLRAAACLSVALDGWINCSRTLAH